MLAIGAAAAAVVTLAVAGSTISSLMGWSARPQTPAALERMLSEGFAFSPPPGAATGARAPTALLLSGCDGPKDNLPRWTAALNAAGWATLVVDSHGPRGLDADQRWRLVCAGQVLPGPERAGDVAVAIDAARRMDGVDPDRIALIGFSHGGWAALDMLALAGRGEVPYNLRDWPDSLAERGLDGVAAAVLVYPYCGPGSVAARTSWESRVPSLFVLVEGDAIADETACLELAGRMTEAGLPVRTTVLSGVTHGFDQQEKAPMSLLAFDAAATEAAIAEAVAFLDGAAR